MKNKLTSDVYIQKLYDFLYSAPIDFFSENYNVLNNNKDLFNIWKSGDQDKIKSFEDKFAKINNYFKQLDIFRQFVECSSKLVTYDSVGGEDIGEKEEEKIKIDPSKIEFYHQYGLLLLKFCKYHHYIFLNKESNEAKKLKKKKKKLDLPLY